MRKKPVMMLPMWVKMDMEKQEFDKYDPVESILTTETMEGE